MSHAATCLVTLREVEDRNLFLVDAASQGLKTQGLSYGASKSAGEEA